MGRDAGHLILPLVEQHGQQPEDENDDNEAAEELETIEEGHGLTLSVIKLG